ncbi:Rieske (2Fe-2S) protein [Streptomyces cadmiisoli]|uniref:Rieske (2Fe-2S) protein n=1 Tax=Streptomyces cadmiisoli TaxID=2184053 RepID=UPI00365A56FD
MTSGDDTTPDATRRTVLLATGAAGAAALVAGCGEYGEEGNGGGKKDSGATSEPAPPGEAAGSAPARPELARTGDIPVGGGTIIKDEQIVVTQPRANEFKAFSSICPHQGCAVSAVSDGTIHCACHGSRFRITDGSVAAGPATQPLSAEPITVAGESITRG